MKNGGAAFPILDCVNEDNAGQLACVASGMTLRDYFAGQALGALASDDKTIVNIVEEAYAFADAMLAEREKKNGEDKA